MTEPKYRRKLNTEQLDVLKLLYKFRFGSNELIAQYFGKKDRSFVFKRMKILQDQGLVGKRFDSSNRIKGKPAAYYLLPDGARALQKSRPGNPINLKPIYKDKAVSEDFVEYCLQMLGFYCRLKDRYGEKLTFVTKLQLAGYEYFSEFVPSAYVRIDVGGTEKDYFLEYLQSSKPFFTAMRRLKQYIDYAGGGGWEAGTESEFPKVLFVCDTSSLQRRLLKSSLRMLDEADEEFELYLTTKANLDSWIDSASPDETIALSQI